MFNKFLKKFKKFIKAFSLVELMVSLITVALITAAFTPTISKKLKDSSVTVVGLSTKCEQLVDKLRQGKSFAPEDKGVCTLCDKTSCVWCGLNRAEEGKYIDEKLCVYKPCEENCEKCPQADVCLKCKPGYELVNKKCQPCTKGTYSDDGKECKACSDGYYPNANTGATYCISCPAGYACYKKDKNADPEDTYSVKTECAAGTYAVGGNASCTLCAKGTYQDQKIQSTCKDCNTGQYQDKEGQTSCKLCAKGSYQDQTKQTSCKLCAKGTYQDQTGQSYCKDCNIDYYCPSEGLSSQSPCNNTGSCKKQLSCTACTHTGAKECIEPNNSTICHENYYLTSVSDIACGVNKSVGKCENCPLKYYCDGKDKYPCTKYDTNCVKCNKNACTECASGYTLVNGKCVLNCKDTEYLAGEICKSCTTWHEKCIKCNKNGCTECAKDYTVDGTGCKLIGCPAGQYRNENGICEECPKGHYCLGGENDKVQCPATEYQDKKGQTSCKSCYEVCKNNKTKCNENGIWESSSNGGGGIMKAWRSTASGGKSCQIFCPYGYYLQDTSNYGCNGECCQSAVTDNGGTCGPGGRRIYVSKSKYASYGMNGLKVSGDSCTTARGGFCKLNSKKNGYKCEYVYTDKKGKINQRPAGQAYQFPEINPPSS